MAKKKEQLDKLTFEERIDHCYEEIEKLKYLIRLQAYFKVVAHRQYAYIVEMRRKVAEDLLEQGFNLKEIGKVFSRDHSSIINLMKIESRKDIKELIKKNYKQWIEEGIYPVSQQQEVYNADYKTGRTTMISYGLARTKEEIEKINSTKLWLKKEKRFYGNTNS